MPQLLKGKARWKQSQGTVTQLGECQTEDLEVAGSSPACPTTICITGPSLGGWTLVRLSYTTGHLLLNLYQWYLPRGVSGSDGFVSSFSSGSSMRQNKWFPITIMNREER